MYNACAELERLNKPRTKILSECLELDCAHNCAGQWCEAAVDTLNRN